MAFDYFAKEKVDIAIIEVGLGGRLDSTNIIMPELAVITNISWDHMNILGNTLEQIAYEKAGIIKRNIQVVIGETSIESKDVFKDVADSLNAPIAFADHVRYATGWKYEKLKLSVEVANLVKDEHHTYHLDLTGYYQTKNLVCVLEAIARLQEKDWKILKGHVEQGLQQVKKLTGLQGRWEIIQHQPLIVLDVGHNVEGIRQIVSQIELTAYKTLHIIIGMVKDKDIENVLALLPKEATYYFTRAAIPRAIPEIELAQKAQAIGLKGNHFPNVNQALETARLHASKEDLILVCGSVFIVGEVEY